MENILTSGDSSFQYRTQTIFRFDFRHMMTIWWRKLGFLSKYMLQHMPDYRVKAHTLDLCLLIHSSRHYAVGLSFFIASLLTLRTSCRLGRSSPTLCAYTLLNSSLISITERNGIVTISKTNLAVENESSLIHSNFLMTAAESPLVLGSTNPTLSF